MNGRSRILLTTVLLAMVVRPSVQADSTQITLGARIRQRCLDVLRTGMRGNEFWPAIHAAEGLTLAGHGKEVIEYLAPKLKTQRDDQRRCGIARELVRAGDRRHSGVILEILAAKNDYGHLHAAESLYKMVEIGDGRDMRRVFSETENLRLKMMTAGALGRCGNPSAMQFLRDMLAYSDSELFRVAAWNLGRIGDESDIPRLKKQLSRCDDELTRTYIEHSMAALGDNDGLQSLTSNLTSKNADVRTYAATFAGDARAASVVQSLQGMLDDPHLDARIRAAQSLLVLAGPPAADPDADVSRDVFPATKQYPRYTEGSILALNDGSLLFGVTEFEGSGSDFAKARIVARSSHDGGRSWGERRVLQENTGGLNVMSVTLRRLRPTGAIAMFYLEKNSFSDLDLLVRFSQDEAASFGSAVRITGDDGYHVVNNDRITQLSSGRLLAPAASTADVRKVNHFVSHCYISDDQGRTWRNGKGHVDAPQRGAMEPEVVELQDGRVLMIVRTQLGFIGKSNSSNGGETWSKTESLDMKAPEAPATVRRVPSTGDLLLLWNNTFTPGDGHGGRRTPLTAALSNDDGETWRVVGNLESDSQHTYSYPSLTFVRDRAVMSYWVSGKDGRLSCRFRSLPVRWFYKKQP